VQELDEQMAYEEHGVEKMNIDISYDKWYEDNKIHTFSLGYHGRYARVIYPLKQSHTSWV
jgi:hypothetical protein